MRQLSELISAVSYEKLNKIINGAEPRLSWSELWNLEDHLRRVGLGVLREESLYEQLAEGVTTFILPSYEAGYRKTVVPHDIDAMYCIQKEVDACRVRDPARQRFEQLDVLHEDRNLNFKAFREKSLSGRHVVAIGSPRTFQPGKILLDEVIRGDCAGTLPFQFAWPREAEWTEGDGIDLGRFAANPAELSRLNPKITLFDDMLGPTAGEREWDPRHAPRAIILSEEPQLPGGQQNAQKIRLADGRWALPVYHHRTSGKPREWMSYGIMAARWIEKRLTIVAAGLGAAETYAVASRINDLRIILWDTGDDAAAVWSVIAVPMTVDSPDQPRPDITRVVTIAGPEILSPPHVSDDHSEQHSHSD